jgi:hypothetical protein
MIFHIDCSPLANSFSISLSFDCFCSANSSKSSWVIMDGAIESNLYNETRKLKIDAIIDAVTKGLLESCVCRKAICTQICGMSSKTILEIWVKTKLLIL